MSKLWIVTKNELMRYFVSPLAYIYLLSFLLLNGSFAVYFGDFFNRGQADLLPMFEFQPWLFLLFIPGIAMRLWAEEFRQKTVVQIVTQPVAIRTLVLGKFFAAWLFCGLALVLTFPFWITVNILGTPDNGVIALGYVAGFVLAGCMLAISQTMSALTKNQVIALVLAVIANLLFFWSGIEYVLSFCRLFLPDGIIDVIASFSFLSHFNTLTRGLLEARDVIFFLSVLLFFNFTTILIINFKTAGTSGWLKSTGRSYYIAAWLMLLLGFFGVNILANTFARRWQYDATQDKIWTLTSSTHDVLSRLPEPVLAKLYFTPELEQRNPNLRQMFDNVRILLQKYKDAANGKFEYKVYYPKFLSEQEDLALAAGVQAVPLIDINQNALFGLTLEDTLQNKAVIPFFAHDRQGALEQDITQKIYQMHRVKKNLGVLTDVPLFGSTENDGTYVRDAWQIVEVLQQGYNVFNIIRPEDFEHPMDALLLFVPRHLSPEMIERIKDYSRQGGKIVAVLDPANETSRLYSYENKPLEPTDLGDLEQFWGIKFYRDYVVADLQNSITVDATINYNSNPVFAQDVIQFKLPKQDMNPNHPVTQHLQELMMASASIIMPDPEAYRQKTISFEPLLKAGDISSVMTSKVVLDGLNPQQILQYFEPDDNPKILAAEVFGLTRDNPFELIVIGDADFLYDSFWADQQKFLTQSYRRESFDNANFLLNALDYLTYEQTLLDLRGKRETPRRFNDIEKMRRLNAMHFKQQESAIFDEIDLAKRALQEVWSKKNFEERENFTADELAALTKVRKHLDELRQQLSEARYAAFKDIKTVADKVTLFNVVLVPAVMTVLILLLYIYRRRQLHCKWQGFGFKFDRQLQKLAAICGLLLALSVLCVYISNRSAVDAYENKPVFPKVSEQINEINRIVLKNHQATLTFVRQDGLWQLQEYPELPVYQERIRRLLTTISEATYFVRKSDKAENLAMFNLSPIEDKNSKAVLVSLQNDDAVIDSFYLGDINVDLGRGAMAAYVRFADKFQVWEIRADFVDMSLDKNNWTYSTLWNLRYGRIYAADDTEKAQQKAMILLKEMLNTPFLQVTDKPQGEPIEKLALNVEEGNKVTISFYKQDDKIFAAYDFDENNQNRHLQLVAKYLTGKAVEIDPTRWEKILYVLKQ